MPSAVISILFIVLLTINNGQNLSEYASLIPLYMEMKNPTKDYIEIGFRLQIVNAGSDSVTLEPSASTVLYNEQKIGTFFQPQIEVKANIGVTYWLNTTIHMNGTENAFENMFRQILNGNDSTITIKSTNMNKDLVIPGAKMQNTHITNITIDSINETEIVLYTQIMFSIASTLHIFATNIAMDLYDQYNNQLGYAIIDVFDIFPGYNIFKQVQGHLVYCDNCSNTSSYNNISIIAFVMNYAINGIDQILNIRGPTGNLVISNTINEDIFVYADCYPTDDYFQFENYSQIQREGDDMTHVNLDHEGDDISADRDPSVGQD